MLNHYSQLSAAANNARGDDSCTCRKATEESIRLIIGLGPQLSIAKKSDRGWNNRHTARLLCPLRYLSEFDKDPEYVVALVSTCL